MNLIVPELKKLRESLVKKRERLNEKVNDRTTLAEKAELINKYIDHTTAIADISDPKKIKEIEKEIENICIQERAVDKRLNYRFSKQCDKDWDTCYELKQKIERLEVLIRSCEIGRYGAFTI